MTVDLELRADLSSEDDDGLNWALRMPRLSFFYGIAIYLYYEDHPPPHIHARYGEHQAKVSIVTGEIFDGSLPRRAAKLVAEWVSEQAERARGVLGQGRPRLGARYH